jgi:hypothetical protein
VTSIGDGFLKCSAAVTALLDLSHLPRLHHVGDYFACRCSAPDVRLPPTAVAIGAGFLSNSVNIAAERRAALLHAARRR